MARYSTSDVMNTFKLGRNTLRLYEEMGLLADMKRTDSGYRVYEAGHLDDLKFILEAKGVGFTLNEIGDLLATLRKEKVTTCGAIASEVGEKISTLDQQMSDLMKKKAFLADFLGTCVSNDPQKACDVRGTGFTKQACC